MPTIQNFNQQQGARPLNPGEANINPASQGKVWEAVGQVGRVVSDLGAEFARRQFEAEAADAIAQRSQSDLSEREAKKEELKREYQSIDPDTGETRFDPRGTPERDAQGNSIYPNSYQRRMGEFLNEQMQAGLESMPNGRARSSYQQFATNSVNRELAEAINFEQIETSKALLQGKDRLAQVGSDALRRNPSVALFQEQAAIQTKYFQENKAGLLAGTDLVKDHDETMRGLLNNGLLKGLEDTNPELGLRLMKMPAAQRDNSELLLKGGNPKEATGNSAGVDPTIVKRYLDKNDVPVWTDRFERALKQKSQVQIDHNKARLDDLTKGALLGLGAPTPKEITSLIEDNAARGVYNSPEEKVRAYSGAFTAMAVGQAKQELSSLSNAELMSGTGRAQAIYKKNLDQVAQRTGFKFDEKFAAGDQVDLQRNMHAAIGSIIQQRNKDPASAVVSSNPTLAKSYQVAQGGMGPVAAANENYFMQSLSEQRRLGVATPKLLQEGVAKDYAARLAGANTQQAATMVDSLRQKTGQFFPQAMNQLINDESLPDYFAVAGYADSPQSASTILEAFRGGKTAKEVLKTNNAGYRFKDVANASKKEFEPYFKSMIGNGTSSENMKVASGLQQAVELDAAMQVARGVHPSDAAARSVEKVIGSRYEIHEGAMVPRDTAPVIKAEMARITSPGFISGAAEFLEAGSVLDGLKDASPEQVQREKTRRFQALNDPANRKWTQSSDGSQLVLNVKRNDGLWIPLRMKGGGFMGVDLYNTTAGGR